MRSNIGQSMNLRLNFITLSADIWWPIWKICQRLWPFQQSYHFLAYFDHFWSEQKKIWQLGTEQKIV